MKFDGFHASVKPVNQGKILQNFKWRHHLIAKASLTSGSFAQLNDFKGCEGFGNLDFFLLIGPPKNRKQYASKQTDSLLKLTFLQKVFLELRKISTIDFAFSEE